MSPPCAHRAPAQESSTPETVEAALREAFLQAETAFTGEITAVDREEGSVLVRWHVEQGIQGVSSGSTYTQREWSGLWSGNTARYTVGQRALVLLRAPSVAGFASPVNDGIIPLRGDGASSTVDLRWIAQHVAVTDEARLRPMLALQAAHGSLRISAGLQEAAARAAAQARAPRMAAPDVPDGSDVPSQSTAPLGSEPNARVDGAMVLDMLHAWQRASGIPQ